MKRMPKSGPGPKTVFILFLTAVLSGACGYRMSGSGPLPGGVGTVAINMMTNRTFSTGLETIFTNAVVTEFNRRRPGSVAGRAQADAVMDGVIESLIRETVARGTATTALERRVRTTVSVTLTDRRGAVLWRGPNIVAEQNYLVNGDQATEDISLQQALGELSQKVAQLVYQGVTDNF